MVERPGNTLPSEDDSTLKAGRSGVEKDGNFTKTPGKPGINGISWGLRGINRVLMGLVVWNINSILPYIGNNTENIE